LSAESSLRISLNALRERLADDPAGCEQLDRIEKTLAGFGMLLEGFQLLPAPDHEKVETDGQ